MEYLKMPVLDPTFNVVVLEFAPARFLYTDKQYADFAEMKEDFAKTGVLKINVDYSDKTIYGAASVNWAARAWHDSCHILADADFSPEGERAALGVMKSQIIARYGETSPDVARWCAILDAEVSGQLEHFAGTGEFPDNQYEFVKSYVAEHFALTLPVNNAGWHNGFAVARIQDRRAAEIAPAQFGDNRAAYRSTVDADARARYLTAGAAAETARNDGPRGISRAVAEIARTAAGVAGAGMAAQRAFDADAHTASDIVLTAADKALIVYCLWTYNQSSARDDWENAPPNSDADELSILVAGVARSTFQNGDIYGYINQTSAVA